jgi:hypothetical protein
MLTGGVIRPPPAASRCVKDDYQSDQVNGAVISKTINDDRVITSAGATVCLNWPLVLARDTNRD